MLKAGCWLGLGASVSLPLDVKLMAVKGFGLHGVAQLCSPTCGSSEVVACLHCLNVRDQGPRQENAKYLTTKPAEAAAVSIGAEGEVGQGTPHFPSPPHPPAEAEDREQQLGTWPNETNPQLKQMSPGSALLREKQWDLP